MPHPIMDAVGLRAVRAKVHAEASTVCAICGLRHLLDTQCPAAPEAADDSEPSPDPSRPADGGESSGGHLDGENEATGTGTDAAVERDDTRARRRVGSLITFFGLDPASFGEVDDGTPSPAVAGKRRPPDRMRRVISFFGFDVAAERTAREEHVVAEPETVPTENHSPAPEVQTAPDDPPPELEAPIAEMVATADDAPPRSWRRADDDILYRPSRRRRSPRNL